MGWYHVNRKMKGINIRRFEIGKLADNTPEEWLPDEEWIRRNYPEACHLEYAKMKKERKLALLGCLVDIPYEYNGPETIPQLAEEHLDGFLEEEYKKEQMYLHAMSVIFCFLHGYPVSAFECLSYDDSWMFVCTVQFPPEEYNEKLSKMTESSLAKELSEFLSVLTGEKYEPKLEWCEEYIKE